MAAGDTQITVTGNLVEDPTLRFTQQGQPVASFRVASTPRYFDKQSNEWKDGDGLFMTVNVWRQQAESMCESITKGTRVVVTGRLKQRTYELKDGSGKRTVLEVEADDVAASLKFASAKISKVARSRTESGGRQSSGSGESDPWAIEAAASYSDVPPPF
jgi:single-strand DNA-binding protein